MAGLSARVQAALMTSALDFECRVRSHSRKFGLAGNETQAPPEIGLLPLAEASAFAKRFGPMRNRELSPWQPMSRLMSKVPRTISLEHFENGVFQ